MEGKKTTMIAAANEGYFLCLCFTQSPMTTSITSSHSPITGVLLKLSDGSGTIAKSNVVVASIPASFASHSFSSGEPSLGTVTGRAKVELAGVTQL